MAGVQKREIPTSIESEEALLGALISNPKDVYINISELVSAEDFYNGANRKIFLACTELLENQQDVDIVTVSDKLTKQNKIEEVGGLGYLSQLLTGTYVCANAETYAKAIHEKAVERRLIEYAQLVTNEAYKDEKTTEELLAFAEGKYREVTQGTGEKSWSNLEEILPEVYDVAEKSAGKHGVTGIPTGFIELDNILHGLQDSNLILVGARPGMGKTAFMLDIAKYAAVNKKIPVVVFNLEMSKREMVARILSSYSGVSSEKLGIGDLSNQEWINLSKAAGDLTSAPIYFDDCLDSSIQSIRAKCRKIKQEKDIRLIIIDYMQLVTSSLKKGSASRQEEVAEISRSLKMMARELNVPIIVGCQLNRDLEERPDKRPVASDLRESGTLEQDADIILMLYRDWEYNKETQYPNVGEVLIRKFRNGKQGKVSLIFDAEHVCFRNMAKKEN